MIEPTEARPPHSPPAYVGPTNLKAILDNIDELLKIAPTSLDATAGVQDLQRLTADRNAVGAWLDELGSDFKRRNGRPKTHTKRAHPRRPDHT